MRIDSLELRFQRMIDDGREVFDDGSKVLDGPDVFHGETKPFAGAFLDRD